MRLGIAGDMGDASVVDRVLNVCLATAEFMEEPLLLVLHGQFPLVRAWAKKHKVELSGGDVDSFISFPGGGKEGARAVQAAVFAGARVGAISLGQGRRGSGYGRLVWW